MAKRKQSNPPKLRLHKASGKAVVTLTDRNTGRRRDVYLGDHGTVESSLAYARLLVQWEENGRVLDGRRKPEDEPSISRSVRGVAVAYWLEIKAKYGDDWKRSSHATDIHVTMRLLRSVCGDTLAADFGPLRLKQVREMMITKGWAKSTIDKRVGVVKRAFKHAVANEVVPPSILVALDAVRNLPRGYKGVADPKRILPVTEADIAAVTPLLPSAVCGVVEVMRYTGARCDEVVRLRPVDIEMTGKVWRAELVEHKGAHRGKRRVVWFGPKAQAVIEPFLDRDVTSPLFSPVDAMVEVRSRRRANRITPESCGNRPGTNRSDDPKRKARNAYTTDSVRRAITRACEKAGVPTWTPHRLRHTAATEIRKAAGLEAAAVVLGHGSATITDAVYAERDESVAVSVLAKIG